MSRTPGIVVLPVPFLCSDRDRPWGVPHVPFSPQPTLPLGLWEGPWLTPDGHVAKPRRQASGRNHTSVTPCSSQPCSGRFASSFHALCPKLKAQSSCAWSPQVPTEAQGYSWDLPLSLSQLILLEMCEAALGRPRHVTKRRVPLPVWAAFSSKAVGCESCLSGTLVTQSMSSLL